MSADGSGGAGGLQFDKVDLGAPAEARSCPICKRPITDEYFEIARAIICGPAPTRCAGSKEGRGAFGRALLFGVGAALLGTLVWYAIIKITDHEFGLLAIGVGLFVGVAVKRGGRGLGGWRYQALAMVLTYVSITGGLRPAGSQGAIEAADAKSTTTSAAASGDKSADATKADAPAATAPAGSATAGSPPAGGGAAQKPGRRIVRAGAGAASGPGVQRPVHGRGQQHHGDHHHRHRALRGLEDQPARAAVGAVPVRPGAPARSGRDARRSARRPPRDRRRSRLSPRVCTECGAQIAEALLACPACGRLVHAAELKQLAAEAAAAERQGDGTGRSRVGVDAGAAARAVDPARARPRQGPGLERPGRPPELRGAARAKPQQALPARRRRPGSAPSASCWPSSSG